MAPTVAESLAGVSAVIVTPFHADGALDLQGLRHNVRFLVERGVRLVVPCGNTGEFYSLTPAECRQVVSATVAAAGGRAAVLAGIGYDTQTALELARHAGDAGAAGVMLHNPIHPFSSERGMELYVRAILDGSPVPVVPYKRTQAVSDALLVRLAGHPNLAGVKYAVEDVARFAAVVQETEGTPVVWVCGLAERWAISFAAAGAVGFTSGIVNFAPELSLALHQVLQAGDYQAARRLHGRIRIFEELRMRHANANNVPAVKEAMNQLGLAGGAVRPPLTALEVEDRQAVTRILREWTLSKYE